VLGAGGVLLLLERVAFWIANGEVSGLGVGTVMALASAHVTAALAATAVLAPGAAVMRRTQGWRAAVGGGGRAAVLMAWPAGKLGESVASGDWASRQAFASVLPWAVVAALAIAAMLVAGLLVLRRVRTVIAGA